MNARTFVVALLGIIVGLSSSAHAQEPLEYAYPDISVWTTQRDSDGKLKNPLVKLAKPLFEKAEIPWSAQDYPAKRMFERLRQGTSKFSMLVNAKSALAGCCLLSKQRVAVVEIRMYRRPGSPAVLTKSDLNGKNVITIRGYSYAGWRNYINEPSHNIVNNVAGDHMAAFSMLEAGRADYVLDYAGPAEEVLAAKSMEEDVTFDSVSQTDVFLVLNKKYPNAEQVMAKLETILKTLDTSEFINAPGR
ncbi:MAG: amino acid ABC transporter [Magnetovibrio sp.]|nr:amino acid ABC transporter [Magnetovibrio sp.]